LFILKRIIVIIKDFRNKTQLQTHILFLGASEKLDKHYLLSNFMFAEKAQLIYTSGHMRPGIQKIHENEIINCLN
jgi:hypothetical protein